MRNAAAVLSAALIVSGCSDLSPSYVRPSITTVAVATDESTSPPSSLVDQIASASLREAVGLAVLNNQDVQLALLNLERARLLQGITVGESRPGLGVAGSIGTSKGTPSSTSLSITMAAYEIDLFGRVKNLRKRALQEYLQRDEVARGTRITVESETVQAWIALASDLQRERNARMRLDLLTRLYEKTLMRFRHGAVGRLELAQADTAVQMAKQDALARSVEVQKSTNALELTIGGGLPLGLLPNAHTRIENLFTSRTAVPREIPSELLLARPDILTAEHALQAAYAGVGVARAERLPRISISSSYSTSGSSGQPSRSIWDAAANAAAPLIDHGAAKRRAEVALTDKEIAVAEYRRTVQVAARETGDVLADAEASDEAACTAAATLSAARREMSIEQHRYDAGATPLSDLLRAEQQVSLAEDQSIQADQSRAGSAVALYRVLGGTWAIATPALRDRNNNEFRGSCEN
jgi:multidrug efflux system outer membrane protein